MTKPKASRSRPKPDPEPVEAEPEAVEPEPEPEAEPVPGEARPLTRERIYDKDHAAGLSLMMKVPMSVTMNSAICNKAIQSRVSAPEVVRQAVRSYLGGTYHV